MQQGQEFLHSEWAKMGVTAEATRSESIAISIDDPQFTAQIRAGEPAALQSVVHAYLD